MHSARESWPLFGGTHAKGLFSSRVAWAFCLPASSGTLAVDFNGGADCVGVRSAIDAASDGDTTRVKPVEHVITNVEFL